MKKSFFKWFLFYHLLSFVFLPDLKAQWQRTNGPRQDDALCFAAKDSFIYMGTWSAGFYRSSDKGIHWEQKGDTLTYNGYPVRIRAITVIDSILFVGTDDIGVFKSSDHGDSWAQVVNGLPIDLSNLPDTTYAYINDFLYSGANVIAAVNGGVYYSNDFGQTWLQSTGIPVSLIVYRLTKKGSTIFASVGNKIYKSIDDGISWTNTGIQFNSGIYCFESNPTSIIAIENPDHVYISNDNGITFQLTSTTIPVNEQINSLLTYGTEIFIGTTRYGIYYSPDNGNSWTTLNNGISRTPTYTLFTHDSDLYAGGNHGVFYSPDHGANWECRNEGIDKYEAPDKIMTQGENIYGLSMGEGMYHSGDNGNAWSPINNGLQILGPGAWPVDFNVAGTNLILGNQNSGVFFSADSGKTWQNKNSGLPCPGAQRVAVSGTDIIIANDTCGMFISHDTGATWISIQNGLPAFTHCGPVVANDSVIYCVFDNNLFLYESRDKGLSWTSVNQQGYIFQIKTSGATVMIILNDRVKISKDQGHTWNSFAAGLPYDTLMGAIDIYSGATNGKDFFICSQGHGIFKLENYAWAPVSWGLPVYVPNHISNVYDLAIQDSLLYASVLYDGVMKRNIDSLEVHTYTGNIFNDINNNGIKDNGETGLPYVIANTKVSNSFYTTDTTGNYVAYADCDYDTIVAITGSLYATVTPAWYAVAQSDSGKDFAVHFIPGVQDLRVTLTNITPARPGFDDQLRITYKNKGTVSMNGTVKLILDSSCYYLYSFPPHDAVNADTITWNFSNLLPLETRNITAMVHAPPNVPIGTWLNFIAHILPVTGDTIPSDNSDSLLQIVMGSYDPNIKEVNLPAISLQQVNNGDYLIYTIHFQNTGTDTAFTVRILDTLDQNLQVPSFEVLSASHPYTYTITGMGIVEFTFNAISLPDSNTNEMNSHGFIKYRIQPKKSLAAGTVIYNTANIYFDFNAPVITNTTSTPIIINVPVYDVNNSNNHLIIYPNPSSDFVNIKNDSRDDLVMKIFNISGQLVYQTLLQGQMNSRISLTSFKKGLFIFNVIGKNSFQTGKLIIE